MTNAGPAVYEWTGPTGVHFIQERHESGTYYHAGTPHAIREILERSRCTGTRLRIWYGDKDTGKSWHDEYGMLGHVGRSGGRIQIPLLILTSRSIGGGALLDDSIVAIADRPGHFVYQHPSLDLGAWSVGTALSDGYAEAAYCDGVLHAQFDREGQAANYCAFMLGDRFAK